MNEKTKDALFDAAERFASNEATLKLLREFLEFAITQVED